MDYAKFKQTIMRTLKRVHPDVNPAPDAAAKTRFLLKLLSFLPAMQAQKGLTLEQGRALVKELHDVR